METAIVSGILEYLAIKKHYCWRQNSAAFKVEERFIRAGFPGISDIIGIHKDTGQLIALEVKQPGKKPTKKQEEFLKNVKDRGGIAAVVTSIDDVMSLGL